MVNNILTLDQAGLSIGGFTLQPTNLRVAPGEYLVLTGPNGAGKSLLLKLICGFYQPGSGTISLGERPLQALPPWQRNIAYVPQDMRLFPNRDVAGNIAFGLEVRGVGKAERQHLVRAMAARLGIENLLQRSIHNLSGGERQKICLARAMVIKADLMLCDEPLSEIDANMQEKLFNLLREHQAELNLPVIHVAHQRREISALADRVARMSDGQLSEPLTIGEYRENAGNTTDSA